MLFAEPMPNWFIAPCQVNRVALPRHWLLSPGFSSNLVVLTWSVMGCLLVLAGLSQWRQAELHPPMYEDTIDTAADVLDRGMIPFTIDSGEFWIDHLRQSDNPVYLQLAERTINPDNRNQLFELTKMKLQIEGTHVYLGSSINPKWEKFGDFHFSKEILEGASPWGGWIVNKLWPLNEQLARHLLRYQQVCIQSCFLYKVKSKIHTI